MVDSVLPPSLNLTDAVVHRARTASKRRLFVDTGAGTLVAVAAIVWKPSGWAVIASAALCFAAFGAWGVADRLLEEHSQLRGRGFVEFLLILRTVAVTVGVAAALILLFGMAGLAMGTWIS
jgi:hypothetical protein